MRPGLRHILPVLAAAACLVACARGPKIIPRSKMVRIYVDMTMADQWLNINEDAFRQADTTLFYEPVFNKYGYTSEDFVASMEHYMRDPMRYARMMKKVAAQLEKKTKEAQRREMLENGTEAEGRKIIEMNE